MFAKGMRRPAEVAREQGVSRQRATAWRHAWEEAGVRGLRQAERAGRPPLLTTKELSQVQRALLKGPAAYGWHTELWTLERVADVIAIETGIRYHVRHVWKVLRRLGWSWQKPARRASERDEEEITRWVSEEWPEKKLARGSRPWIVFERTLADACGPAHLGTAGQDPVLHHPFNSKRISMAPPSPTAGTAPGPESTSRHRTATTTRSR